MGKNDNRAGLKVRRRKGQRKKKERLAKKAEKVKEARKAAS